MIQDILSAHVRNIFMKQYQKHVSYTLISIALLCGAYYMGLAAGKKEVSSAPTALLMNTNVGKPQGVDFGTFWKAWAVLNEKYVPTTSTTTISDQAKVYGAIQGLASSLKDPYTVFFPPVENEIFQADVRGNFEGVGMEIGIKDSILTVVTPLKGSPAEIAGLKAGDQIVKINETSTYNLSTEESVALIRGPKGTNVVFTVVRKGEKDPRVISVTRDVINIPTLNTHMREDGVFVIELYNFSESSPDLFRKALREFIEARTDKLLLDLRGNPGGYLEAAIDMASWFLPPGKVVVSEDFGDKKEPTVFRSRGYDIFNNQLKFVILIDNGSASASEILAGALKEQKVATLVGEKTFGKGSVQELIKITPDTSLKVTIARWLTPDGTSISKSGIVPDVEVKNTKEDIEAGRDPQKEKAVEILLNMKK